jgi:UDP-N-acetylmuramoyl-L-alanyl-D-glutamate--2,6-diaminopimelate ligase
VRVGDTRGALAKLAAAFWGLRGDNQRRLCLIGITGTNGKTTVAWMLRSILRSAGERTALLGTVEYDLLSERRPAPLTTPGSLELCRLLSTACGAGATHGVMEVSSHALDQRRCDGLGFAAGVFTNLTGDHLDYHKTMEAYLTAKRRLFESLSREATAIINRDDPASHELMRATRARVVTYGLASIDTEVRAALLKMNRSTTEFVIQVADAEVAVRNSMIGRHNVLNALAAAATAHALGVSPAAIADGLRCMSEVPGRLQRAEPVDWPFSVFVDYAHTDDALRNVLTALRPLTAGRLICVFGCGGDRDRSKRPRMAAAVAEWADAAYVTSDNPRSEEPHAIIEEILPGFADRRRCTVVVETDRRRAIESALSDAHEGDTVLIAGKGHENYQIIGDRVLAFDDVDVARRWFAARERKREVA